MIKKEYPTLVEFKGWMKELKKFKDCEDGVNKVLKEYNTEAMFYGSFPEDFIVSLIRALMNDKDDWIGWWIYDHKWGKGKLNAYDKNKKLLKSKTISDLYNLLTK